MINLLPREEKEEIQKEKTFRILLHLLLAIFLSTLLFVFLIFGTNLVLREKTKNLAVLIEEQEKRMGKEVGTEIKDILNEIQLQNKRLTQILKIEKEKKKFSSVLEKIFEILPPRIKFESLSLNFKKEKKIEVFLSGFSEEREDLILFKERLEEHFSEVSFPPQIWFEEKNINFTVSFKEQ